MKYRLIVLTLIMTAIMTGCSTGRDDFTKTGALSHSKESCLPPSRYGNPDCYDVDGQRYYVLKTSRGYCKTGLASWYGTKFHGRKTSSREPYDMFALTAASRNLPIPTYVEVTNLENGKKIIVKVNDRGPFKSDRIIDLSYAAAAKLGFANRGTANVEVRALGTTERPMNEQREEIILANQGAIPEIQINLLTLPPPSEGATSIRVARYLQLGAFADRKNAERLMKDICTYLSEQAFIKEALVNNKTIFRVQIGPFDGQQDSDQTMQILKEHGVTKVITVFN